jgi:CheY-like chemotaxis protein
MAPQTPLHVLVVDDEPGFLSGLTRLLQRDGHLVETATDGHAALALLQEGGYNLILCDLRMPALDGQTFYGLLQRQLPALCQRIIFLTGDTLSPDSMRFVEQCGLPWIAKPCRIEEIRAAIARVLSVPVHDTSVLTTLDDLQQPFTLAEIQAWIDTTKQKRDDLHLLAADPLYKSRREWAFLEMSKLLAEAIEEVRIISVSLQEDSMALRSRATALRQHSTALIERSIRASDQLGHFNSSHQEIPEADRRMLDISEST